MKNIKIYFVLLLLVCAMTSYAQGISVSAPTGVTTGENFRIAYTINNQNAEGFKVASIPSGLEVIAGPYTSRQSSIQIINGHTTSSSSTTFTYTLYAEKPGNYVIPGARATVGGKTLASKPVHIRVSGSVRHNGSSSPNMHDEDQLSMRTTGTRISGNDLFVKVSANKRRVHEQEPILLTYKVYTLVNLTSLDGKMPDLTGFHTQEVKLPQQKSFHVEKLNGRNYNCVTWSQYVMYPQMTGMLKIPSITFNGIVVMQNRSVDPIEAFLNGGSGCVEVKRSIVAPGMNIQVDPLPSKPVGFSGGVGNFTISAQLNNTKIKAGSPATLRVVVGGVGNLKLIRQPTVNFPTDFDKYDAKVIDKTSLTSNGIEGNMIYDFLFVPRNQGHYEIPKVSLIYFDTTSGSYKTISTQPIALDVEKGDGSNASVSDYSGEKASDIKGIKEGKLNIFDGSFFWGSTVYWICVILPIILFLVFVYMFRKKAIESADIVGLRGKRANKVATRRLKTAYKLLCANRQSEFYDEVLRALWGYAGDKLNMPVEMLSRDNISDKLQNLSISSDTVGKFISALDECEFERYAPGDAAGNMNKTYDFAMNAIMNIENAMKTKRKKDNSDSKFSVLLLIVVLFSFSITANAVSKDNADAEYKKGNYAQAAIDYEEILSKNESFELFYNLGCCYYRMGNLTKSIIAYERALRLSPGDSDTRFNLQLLRSKTVDKVISDDDIFFVVWYESCVNAMSADGWARFGLFALVLSLLLFAGFIISDKVSLRKSFFYSAIVLLCVFITSNIFAFQQKQAYFCRDKAVVIKPSINVMKTPSDNSSEAFVIHEGTSVKIIDRTIKGWFSVKLGDGREGWLKIKQVEII